MYNQDLGCKIKNVNVENWEITGIEALAQKEWYNEYVQSPRKLG